MAAVWKAGGTYFSSGHGARVRDGEGHGDDGVVQPRVERGTGAECLACTTGGRAADPQVGVREGGVGQAEAELEAGLDVVLSSELSAYYFRSEAPRRSRAGTYDIEVAVVDEDALRVWDLHRFRPGIGDSRGVVGLGLRDREGELATVTNVINEYVHYGSVRHAYLGLTSP